METNEMTSNCNALPTGETPLPEILADYPGIVELPVQWGEQDPYGHVNNAMFFRWFESARAVYAELVGMDILSGESTIGPILASTGCNYRRQVKYPDRVLVGCRVAKMKSSSMTMEYLVYSIQQQLAVADGQSVVVTFDYENQKPVRIPDEMRADIERLEGREI